MSSLSLIRSFLSEERFLCSICLDVFSSPASTPCGHTFCLACIQRFWDGDKVCRCPLCKETFRKRPDLQINRTLREITDQFKAMTGGTRQRGGAGGEGHHEEKDEGGIPIPASPPFHASPPPNPFSSPLATSVPSYPSRPLEPSPLLSRSCTRRRYTLSGVGDSSKVCPRHRRRLKTFCKSDHSCICSDCEKNDHRGHQTTTVEKHWMETKVLLSGTVQEVREMIKLRQRKIEEIRASLNDLTGSVNRQAISSMCLFSAFLVAMERLQSELLDAIETKKRVAECQADTAIGQLEQEVVELKKRYHTLLELGQSEDYVYCIKTYSALSGSSPPILDWPGVSVTSDPGMGAVYRCLSSTLDRFRQDLKRMEDIGFLPEVSVLRQEPRVKRIQEYAVEVTLDSNTAHPKLILSEDRKRVKCGDRLQMLPDNPERFDRMVCVLGQEGFTSGRYYWEVEVGRKTDWDLGVASQSVNRKGKVQVTPSNGYWFLSLRDKNKDSELTADLPQKIGVFLDYDKGQVSFFNVEAKQHIYTFMDSFSDRLFPFFSPCSNKSGKNDGPLIITPLEETG